MLYDASPGVVNHGPGVQVFRFAVLREPLSRILSSFHYEGFKLVDCEDGTACTRTLAKWIADTQREAEGNNGTRLWQSVSEYYTRTFAGASAATTINEEHYWRAARRLASFDAIFVTETLGARSATSIARAVFPPEACTLDSTESSFQLGFSLKRMTHANSNEAKNVALGPLSPAAFAREDPSAYSTMRDLNIWDSKLYVFAERLHQAQALAWERAFASPACSVECPLLAPVLSERIGVRIAPDIDDNSRAPLYGCRKKHGWRARNSSIVSV